MNDHSNRVTVIEPSGWFPPLGRWVGDLREYRELLYFLAWRDVKVRYKQAALGAAWAVIQPLAAMLVFTLIFGRLARMPTDGAPYPVFVYAALLPWTYFANAVAHSGESLVGSAQLLTKVFLPRVFVPAAPVIAGLVDLAIGVPLLVGLMIWYGIAPGPKLLLLPLLGALASIFAFGVGLWVSALNVKYRDVRHAVPFLLQLWFFATPVVYPSSLAGERWGALLAVNPMAGVVEGFRAALFGTAIPWAALVTSTGLTLAVVAGGLVYFRSVERFFADVV